MKSTHLAGALTAAAALALPATALAHPTVYESTAKVLPAGPVPPTQGGLLPQTRYLVTNHGFSYVLRESNNATDHGVMNYAAVPGAYRNQPGFESVPGTRTRLLKEADTGAQAHATCRGVAKLDNEAAILAWQGADPFYNYVPFQKTSAGLEDDPAAWIPVVKTLTGVDLETQDPAAACAALSGIYTPADEMQTTTAALNSGYLEHETAPLNAQIATLTKAVTDADAARATLQGLLDAAKAELTKLATPMKAVLPSAKLKGRSLASKGTSISVTGPAGARVTVELAISEARARKLKLNSSVLASAKATLGANGTAKVGLKAKKSARRTLRNLKRAIAIEVTAHSGDRIATTRGTLTR